jgi:hypothetical protein
VEGVSRMFGEGSEVKWWEEVVEKGGGTQTAGFSTGIRPVFDRSNRVRLQCKMGQMGGRKWESSGNFGVLWCLGLLG